MAAADHAAPDSAAARSVPITIQGKPAVVTYDKDLFWLNRLSAGNSPHDHQGEFALSHSLPN